MHSVFAASECICYTFLTNPHLSIFTKIGGIDGIHMKPGSKVLYLGAAAGTTVSHVSDIVGPTGCVYAVEFAHRPGRDLINMAKSRTNVIPIIEDARHPLKYRMLMGKTSVERIICITSLPLQRLHPRHMRLTNVISMCRDAIGLRHTILTRISYF